MIIEKTKVFCLYETLKSFYQIIPLEEQYQKAQFHKKNQLFYHTKTSFEDSFCNQIITSSHHIDIYV